LSEIYLSMNEKKGRILMFFVLLVLNWPVVEPEPQFEPSQLMTLGY